MNYYIGDLHLGWRSQFGTGVNYDNRPFCSLEEMHNVILSKWNKKVTNGDTVYFIGDTAMRGHNDDVIALVAQLKGRKVLVKGNHDDLSDYRYKQLFSEIVSYKEITDSVQGKTYKLVLSHFPIMFWSGQHRGSILLYAHTHDTEEEIFFQECLARFKEMHKHRGNFNPTAINVGCMFPYMEYEPRTLAELLKSKEIVKNLQ